MNEKFKKFIALFRSNGIKQITVVKLLILFGLGHFFLLQLIGKGPVLPNSYRPYLKDSLFLSLPIKLLAPLRPDRATRMGLKLPAKKIIIPEVFIHHIQLETPTSGMAKVEIHSQDLQSVLNGQGQSVFIAFPYNQKLHQQPLTKESYEIHLDRPCVHGPTSEESNFNYL